MRARSATAKDTSASMSGWLFNDSTRRKNVQLVERTIGQSEPSENVEFKVSVVSTASGERGYLGHHSQPGYRPTQQHRLQKHIIIINAAFVYRVAPNDCSSSPSWRWKPASLCPGNEPSPKLSPTLTAPSKTKNSNGGSAIPRSKFSCLQKPPSGDHIQFRTLPLVQSTA